MNSWEQGQLVKVGFMKDLEVVRVRKGHGDYILRKGGGYYHFMPHQGIRKIMGIDKICQALGCSFEEFKGSR